MTSSSYPYAGSRPSEAPAEWTLADLASVLVRRRIWILAAIVACCTLALLDGWLSTPRYRATAVIEVQKQSRGAFGLDNVTADTPSSSVSDSFDDNLNLQTEIGILQSDAIALDVIHRTGLESTPDYFARRSGPFPWLHRLRFWSKPLESLSVPLADAPNRRYVALKTFAHRRKISPVAGTRLISVTYSDPDPRRAAAVATALVQALSDYSWQSRSAAAVRSSAWLEDRLAQLRQQTDTLDARAAALDRSSGNLGDSEAHNVVLTRLDQLSAALSAAESSRVVREAIWRSVQSGSPEAISSLGGNPASGPDTQNAFALLQSLRAQQSSARAQLAELDKRYGENWPAVAEQRARLATIDNSIHDEVGRIGERVRSDYEISLRAEASAREAFDQQKNLASSLTGDAVNLRLARQEAEESRGLYTSLLGRLQQTGVLEGLHSINFTLVTPAMIPPPDHPSSPTLPLLLALALAAGTLVGSAAAIVRELTDDAVHTSADLEALFDAPVFACIPSPASPSPWLRRLLPAGSRALALNASADPAAFSPASPFSEAIHTLRASLLLSHSSRAPQVITVAPAEVQPPGNARQSRPGSESLAFNLAAVLAQHGSPVLFVDADLRSVPPPDPSPTSPGLSQLLATDMPPAPQQHAPDQPLLSLVHAGPRPPCPAELIASSRMASLLAQWRRGFAFVVIQSPAAVYADALVLAQLSDAVLLTARAGCSRKAGLRSAWQSFSRQVPGHAVLGTVLQTAAHGVPYAQV